MGHSSHHVLPLVEIRVVHLSRVDDLLFGLATGDKDLLPQQRSSCGKGSTRKGWLRGATTMLSTTGEGNC